MKQHISPADLAQLSDEQKERLREWWKPRAGDVFYGKFYYCDAQGNECYSQRVCVNDDNYFQDVYKHPMYEKKYGKNPDIIMTCTVELCAIEKGRCLPLLSVGQMIQLLQDKAAYFNISNMYARLDDKPPGWGVMKPDNFDIRADELADALWRAVKEVL